MAVKCLAAAFVLATLTSCADDRVKLARHATFLEVDNKHPYQMDWSAARATVLVFITVDCPISNGYAPEINQIARDYCPRGIAMHLVQVDRDLTVAQARQHAKDFGHVCPVLLDPKHQLVKAVGATVTPEAAVIDSDGRLAYRGRIDDRYVDLGKRRSEPTNHDLRDAIDAVLNGKPVTTTRTQAVGCYIPEPAT